MRVKDVMTVGAVTVSPEESAREAILRMREADCGLLPVVREDRAEGVVTDRDLSLALAERDVRPSELPVSRVMSRSLWVCREDENVREALETMRSKRVRRLPAVDARGKLRGILALNDVIRRAEPEGTAAISHADAVETLRVIGEHRYPAKRVDNVDVTALSEFV